MEGRAFVSALSVGIGIGVGLGVGRTVNRLASGGDSAASGLTPQAMEREMLSLIMDGRDSKVTFYEFPYYLSEQTRSLLTMSSTILSNCDLLETDEISYPTRIRVRHDFRRWQNKMHFFLTTLEVVYVLTTSMPELLEDDTMEANRSRAKWKNDDYICREHILNGIIHETSASYTPQQNGVAERKNEALKEMMNSMLSYLGLSDGFWGETMAVVRLSDLKRKTLGEKCIDCIFVRYAEHSKAYRFYDPKDIIPNSNKSQKDDHLNDVSSETLEPRKVIWALKWKRCGKWTNYIKIHIKEELRRNCPICFRQKEGIDYFDIFAPVARITTIRLLIALATIHNPVIHQMDVKIAFLNGDLKEKVYIMKLKGFVMPSNELRLIFGTDQYQVDKTKKFLSSMFSMKDMEEADVNLGIKIKHENKGLVITQSHYNEKILKKFNREDCSSVSTLMDPVEMLVPNTDKPLDQLKYSIAIGCLMYVMASTRPDIAYAVDRLSRFTSNPITRVFKYLKGTMNYGLSYIRYPLVLEGYLDAFKKQTCITGSTMESEFVALAVAGKEAQWLRNLIHEIPI
uniref:Uncharacterized protein n=1 Tax=Tanacetum cinerariifolium TaxID=118510 RepID=A0A6L2P446_TANCI|nr:hypothetical protein [Tanacetum cinerariifolium]